MINLPFPVPTNALYRNVGGKGRVRTTRYNKWLDAAGWAVVRQRLGCMAEENQTDGPYHLEITLERPDKRKRDLDNLAKAICDLLVKQRITDDDRHLQSLTMRWSDAVEGPTVKVRAGG